VGRFQNCIVLQHCGRTCCYNLEQSGVLPSCLVTVCGQPQAEVKYKRRQGRGRKLSRRVHGTLWKNGPTAATFSSSKVLQPVYGSGSLNHVLPTISILCYLLPIAYIRAPYVFQNVIFPGRLWSSDWRFRHGFPSFKLFAQYYYPQSCVRHVPANLIFVF
jgi:hypothetical protein